MKFYIRLANDEWPAPRYVERGMGFGGVAITGSLRNAKRYSSEEEAGKIAEQARRQKNKEPGGETTTVEVVKDDTGEDPSWDVRARFELPTSGTESRFEMKKTGSGIVCRYVDLNGNVSKEYAAESKKQAVSDWINCVGAWFANKIEGRGAEQ